MPTPAFFSTTTLVYFSVISQRSPLIPLQAWSRPLSFKFWPSPCPPPLHPYLTPPSASPCRPPLGPVDRHPNGHQYLMEEHSLYCGFFLSILYHDDISLYIGFFDQPPSCRYGSKRVTMKKTQCRNSLRSQSTSMALVFLSSLLLVDRKFWSYRLGTTIGEDCCWE